MNSNIPHQIFVPGSKAYIKHQLQIKKTKEESQRNKQRNTRNKQRIKTLQKETELKKKTELKQRDLAGLIQSWCSQISVFRFDSETNETDRSSKVKMNSSELNKLAPKLVGNPMTKYNENGEHMYEMGTRVSKIGVKYFYVKQFPASYNSIRERAIQRNLF